MAVEFERKAQYGMQDLLTIMELLRSENGCPWDREQTHQSIRKNFIEETYEVVEAIDADDPVLMREELGDVLLQVVFHSQMEKEQNRFDFQNVVHDVCEKLIVRHPHIFGEVTANTSEEVLRNWEEIKKRQKGQKTQTEAVLSVPKVLPALMRSQKVQKRAADAGMDFPDLDSVLESLQQEIDELRASIRKQDAAGSREEIGDVLFSAVNAARFLSLDAEECLTESTEKFISRFVMAERLAQEAGQNLKDSSLDDLNKFWMQAKKETGDSLKK